MTDIGDGDDDHHHFDISNDGNLQHRDKLSNHGETTGAQVLPSCNLLVIIMVIIVIIMVIIVIIMVIIVTLMLMI